MSFTRFALAFSALVFVRDLGGQVPLDAAIRTLKPGDSVRIRVRAGDRIESRIASVHAEPLRLQLAAGAALDAAVLDSLWVRGKATQTGTNTGAVVGGVGSFAFWAAVCSGISEGKGCDAWDAVAALSVAGVIGGALLGAGIGALVPKWRLRYARALPVQGALILLPNGRVGLGAAYTVSW